MKAKNISHDCFKAAFTDNFIVSFEFIKIHWLGDEAFSFGKGDIYQSVPIVLL